jgi:hypothetical protein
MRALRNMSLPRHFTTAGPSMAPASCFVRRPSRRTVPQLSYEHW